MAKSLHFINEKAASFAGLTLTPVLENTGVIPARGVATERLATVTAPVHAHQEVSLFIEAPPVRLNVQDREASL